MEKTNRWYDKKYFQSAMIGAMYLIVSLIINYYAGLYTNKEVSNAVTDILLDNLPVFNVSYIFIEGAILFMVFVVVLMAIQPKRIPFVLKSTALFIIIRSFFVILTHIGPSPERIAIDVGDELQKIFFDNQLFFSGHTGLPFLFALMFRRNRRLFYIFLFTSFVGAVSVILGHLHYTIDVFGAFFITYTIYHISIWLFPSDHELFLRTAGAEQGSQVMRETGQG